jgi:hypothetical protein
MGLLLSNKPGKRRSVVLTSDIARELPKGATFCTHFITNHFSAAYEVSSPAQRPKGKIISHTGMEIVA